MSPIRQIIFTIVAAAHGRSLYALVLMMLAGSVVAANKEAPPAWRNCVDKAAAEDAIYAYTSNVIRCEWAGENPKVANLMPANLAFQFAVIGDRDVTNRVQRILMDVADSINPAVRSELEEYGLLNSTLQWIVRACSPDITNVVDYLSAKAHPAVFKESDFNAEKLKSIARRISRRNIPLSVIIQLEYPSSDVPLGKALPGVDYPDVLPEETFTSPFGSALVLRAPERIRKFRLSAKIYPERKVPVKFIWKTTGSGSFYPWSKSIGDAPEDGHADFVFNTLPYGPRFDVMVFAQLPNGMIGPPTILSIYKPPFMACKYTNHKLQSIAYGGKSNDIPYDISSIWIPHEWKDEYSLNMSGQILTFTRSFPNRIDEENFTATGEVIYQMSSSGYPLSARKVEYYVSPESGRLEYKEVGDIIKYRLGNSPCRKSGE